jgi:hypothetical protein
MSSIVLPVPKHHWQFKQREGSNVPDSIGGVVGKGHKIRQDVGVGRIGESVQLIRGCTQLAREPDRG